MVNGNLSWLPKREDILDQPLFSQLGLFKTQWRLYLYPVQASVARISYFHFTMTENQVEYWKNTILEDVFSGAIFQLEWNQQGTAICLGIWLTYSSRRWYASSYCTHMKVPESGADWMCKLSFNNCYDKKTIYFNLCSY